MNETIKGKKDGKKNDIMRAKGWKKKRLNYRNRQERRNKEGKQKGNKERARKDGPEKGGKREMENRVGENEEKNKE
jgi:hypothetical protein